MTTYVQAKITPRSPNACGNETASTSVPNIVAINSTWRSVRRGS